MNRPNTKAGRLTMTRPPRGAEAEGGWTEEYEIVCCYCGDDPDLDYHAVHRGCGGSAGHT